MIDWFLTPTFLPLLDSIILILLQPIFKLITFPFQSKVETLSQSTLAAFDDKCWWLCRFRLSHVAPLSVTGRKSHLPHSCWWWVFQFLPATDSTLCIGLTNAFQPPTTPFVQFHPMRAPTGSWQRFSRFFVICPPVWTPRSNYRILCLFLWSISVANTHWAFSSLHPPFHCKKVVHPFLLYSPVVQLSSLYLFISLLFWLDGSGYPVW